MHQLDFHESFISVILLCVLLSALKEKHLNEKFDFFIFSNDPTVFVA